MRNESAGASRTFVSIERASGVVAGYYCLSASALRSEEAPRSLKANMPNPIPVILIGRLAVDSRFKEMNLGASLLQDAISKGVEASRLIGAKAFMVHALNDKAVSFYRKFDFSLVPEANRVMYLLMSDVETTIVSITE
jgi:predicted N-acetyltransferase YhbS